MNDEPEAVNGTHRQPAPTWWELRRDGLLPPAVRDWRPGEEIGDGLTWYERRQLAIGQTSLPALPAPAQLPVRAPLWWARSERSIDEPPFEHQGSVAIITRSWSDDPADAVRAEQAATLALLDDEIRVIVILGTGSRAVNNPASRALIDEILAEVGVHPRRRLTAAPIESDKLIIAAIAGRATGAGLADALACDLRVLGESAALDPAWAREGTLPDPGVEQTLPRLVGPAKAIELLALSEPIRARRALDLGLANWVVSDYQLRSFTLDLAGRLARNWNPQTASIKSGIFRPGAGWLLGAE